MVKVVWTDVAWAIVWPPLSLDATYLMAVVAVLGTTISPYLFFWQAGQEVADEKELAGAKPLVRAPEQALSMALGVALNFSPIDPIKALYSSAVLSGVVAVPVMVMMMRLTRRPAIMASFTPPRSPQVMGWLATVAMAAHSRRQGRVVARVIEA
jgi:Mn2+/Fe2+ NRAMP family transporter